MKKPVRIRIAVFISLLTAISLLAILVYFLIPNRWGFINKNGDLVITPQFEDVSKAFLEEPHWPALVKKDGKWQYIERSGKKAIALSFDKSNDNIVPGNPPEAHAYVAFEFGNGLAVVFVDGKQALIDSTGKISYLSCHSSVSPICHYREGLACFFDERGNWGYIDSKGKIVIPANFLYTGGFSDGLASATTAMGTGFIDKSGQFAIKPIFEDTGDFSEGLAKIRQKEYWGYINRAGSIVIEPKFAQARGFFEGLAYVELRKPNESPLEGSWGYIDRSGKFIIGPKPISGGFEISTFYPKCLDFSEGLAACRKNGRYGYIDRTGAWVIEPQFSRPGRFSDNLAAVQFPHYLDFSP